MYGENPFLVIKNKLFLLSCQSLILIFRKTKITYFTISYAFHFMIKDCITNPKGL